MGNASRGIGLGFGLFFGLLLAFGLVLFLFCGGCALLGIGGAGAVNEAAKDLAAEQERRRAAHDAERAKQAEPEGEGEVISSSPPPEQPPADASPSAP